MIVIISTLGLFAIQRLLIIQVQAERAAMDTVLGSLRSALGMRLAAHILKNDIRAILFLAHSNPMEQLAETPENYIGVLTSKDPDPARRGIWYFDRDARVLIYRVRNDSYFKSDVDGSGDARFSVQVLYAKKKGRRRSANLNGIEGLRLVALEPYHWIN